MQNLYLDQNVLGLIAEGMLNLRPKEPVRWVYSGEHLAEVARGEALAVLDVLRHLKAQRLVLQSDERGRITDNWVIEPYADPADLYEEYKQRTDGFAVDPAIFTGLIATLFGAQDQTLLESYPDDIAEQVRKPLKEVPWLDALLGDTLETATRRTGEATIKHLSGVEVLEKRRKPLGLNKGRGSSFADSDNPLQALWEHANKHFPSPISAEQFFGFEPTAGLAESFGYEKWPIFLGISTCYNLLNAIGYLPDKGLAKTSRVAANSSDGHHVAYAAFCDGLISADSRMCKKAFAIYKYRGIGSGVLDVSSKLAG